MPRPYSINQRTLLTTTLVLFCFLGIVGWVLDQAFRNSAAQGVQQRLETTLYGLLAVAEVTDKQQLSIPNFLTDERFNRPGSGLFALITGRGNKIVWQSRSLLGEDIPTLAFIPEGGRIFSPANPSDPRFIYSAGIAWEINNQQTIDYTFHILSSQDSYLAQVTQFRQSLWGWLAAVTLILLVIQLVLLRWSLAPLRQVTNDLLDVENGKQNHLGGDYPLELHGLTYNLNHLLNARQQQLTRYRNALADLAHSLKTPLAVLRSLNLASDTKQQQTINKQTEHMTRIINYQLQRAATAGQAGLLTDVLIKPVIQRIIDTLNKVYAEKHISSELQIAEQLKLAIEEDDLMELSGNLLDNAFKWATSTVRVSAIKQDNHLIIEFEDDGPGIDAALTSQMMQRGARADMAVAGQGIGLAVCHDIVSAYHGTIRIDQSELSGARIIVTFTA